MVLKETCKVKLCTQTQIVRHLHTYIYTKQCYIPSQGNIYSCDFSHKELANWHFNHETLPVIPNLSEWTIKTKTSLSIQYTMYLTKQFFYTLQPGFIWPLRQEIGLYSIPCTVISPSVIVNIIIRVGLGSH